VISQLPFRYTGEGADATDGFPLLANTGGGYKVGYGDYGRLLNQSSADYLAMLASRNFDVVADFVLLDEVLFEPYLSALADIPVLFVGLYCNADTLSERNENRKDRAVGLSVNQQEKIHFCEKYYDIKLDSTNHSSGDLATSLFDHLQQNSPTPGFV